MIKRVAIIGPESTGKSDLAAQLAKHFQTAWVPEYARAYIDGLSRKYIESDLPEIAKGQCSQEDQKAEQAREFLFCDTNLIVIKIWSDNSYGHTDPWILKELSNRQYDFYLLTDIDLPWKADPQREHPNQRDYFFDLYERYLKEHGLPYAIVSGIRGERLKKAIEAIEYRFSS